LPIAGLAHNYIVLGRGFHAEQNPAGINKEILISYFFNIAKLSKLAGQILTPYLCFSSVS